MQPSETERNFDPMMKNGLSVIVVCAVAMTGCSSDQPTASSNTELFTHAGSNIPFPFEMEGFKRISITEGEPDEAGVTVEYFFSQRGETVPMEVTIYAHPDPPDPEEYAKDPKPNQEMQKARMDEVTAEILEAGKDREHRFIAYYDVVIVRDEKPFFAKRLFFRDKFDWFTNVYIVEYGKWLVEYRMVFPRNLERNVDDFVLRHEWNTVTEDSES